MQCYLLVLVHCVFWKPTSQHSFTNTFWSTSCFLLLTSFLKMLFGLSQDRQISQQPIELCHRWWCEGEQEHSEPSPLSYWGLWWIQTLYRQWQKNCTYPEFLVQCEPRRQRHLRRATHAQGCASPCFWPSDEPGWRSCITPGVQQNPTRIQKCSSQHSRKIDAK